MRFSGKKKRRGFGSFAGGSTRGTPESHVPGGTGGKIPGVPGIPGMPGRGGLPAGPKPQQREPLYGKKAPKKGSRWPLIIMVIVAAVVVACIVIAALM
jgi:hypothetical protein